MRPGILYGLETVALTREQEIHVSWSSGAEDATILVEAWSSGAEDATILVEAWSSGAEDATILVEAWSSGAEDATILVEAWSSGAEDATILVEAWSSGAEDATILVGSNDVREDQKWIINRGTAHVGRFGEKLRDARLRWYGHVLWRIGGTQDNECWGYRCQVREEEEEGYKEEVHRCRYREDTPAIGVT